MKIPAQPKDDREFFFGRIYKIPIAYEEVPEAERYTRAPRIISKRLNKPRSGKSHIHKTGLKSMWRMFGYIERGKWVGCGCCKAGDATDEAAPAVCACGHIEGLHSTDGCFWGSPCECRLYRQSTEGGPQA